MFGVVFLYTRSLWFLFIVGLLPVGGQPQRIENRHPSVPAWPPPRTNLTSAGHCDFVKLLLGCFLPGLHACSTLQALNSNAPISWPVCTTPPALPSPAGALPRDWQAESGIHIDAPRPKQQTALERGLEAQMPEPRGADPRRAHTAKQAGQHSTHTRPPRGPASKEKASNRA